MDAHARRQERVQQIRRLCLTQLYLLRPHVRLARRPGIEIMVQSLKNTWIPPPPRVLHAPQLLPPGDLLQPRPSSTLSRPTVDVQVASTSRSVDDIQRASTNTIPPTNKKPALTSVDIRSPNDQKPAFTSTNTRPSTDEKPAFTSANTRPSTDEKPAFTSAETKQTTDRKAAFTSARTRPKYNFQIASTSLTARPSPTESDFVTSSAGRFICSDDVDMEVEEDGTRLELSTVDEGGEAGDPSTPVPSCPLADEGGEKENEQSSPVLSVLSSRSQTLSPIRPLVLRRVSQTGTWSRIEKDSKRQSSSSNGSSLVTPNHGLCSIPLAVEPSLPSSSVSAPCSGVSAPSRAVRAPSSSLRAPCSSVSAPSSSVSAPSSLVRAPSSSVSAPSSSVSAPSSSVRAPSSSVRAPSSSVRAPSSSVRAPSSSVRAPSSSVRAPSSSVSAPLSSVSAPSSSVRAPSSSVRAPSSSVRAPSSSVRATSSSVSAPSSSVRAPSSSVSAPSSSVCAPYSSVSATSSSVRAPSSSVSAPLSSVSVPSSSVSATSSSVSAPSSSVAKQCVVRLCDIRSTEFAGEDYLLHPVSSRLHGRGRKRKHIAETTPGNVGATEPMTIRLRRDDSTAVPVRKAAIPGGSTRSEKNEFESDLNGRCSHTLYSSAARGKESTNDRPSSTVFSGTSCSRLIDCHQPLNNQHTSISTTRSDDIGGIQKNTATCSQQSWTGSCLSNLDLRTPSSSKSVDQSTKIVSRPTVTESRAPHQVIESNAKSSNVVDKVPKIPASSCVEKTLGNVAGLSADVLPQIPTIPRSSEMPNDCFVMFPAEALTYLKMEMDDVDVRPDNFQDAGSQLLQPSVSTQVVETSSLQTVLRSPGSNNAASSVSRDLLNSPRRLPVTSPVDLACVAPSMPIIDEVERGIEHTGRISVESVTSSAAIEPTKETSSHDVSRRRVASTPAFIPSAKKARVEEDTRADCRKQNVVNEPSESRLITPASSPVSLRREIYPSRCDVTRHPAVFPRQTNPLLNVPKHTSTDMTVQYRLPAELPPAPKHASVDQCSEQGNSQSPSSYCKRPTMPLDKRFKDITNKDYFPVTGNTVSRLHKSITAAVPYKTSTDNIESCLELNVVQQERVLERNVQTCSPLEVSRPTSVEMPSVSDEVHTWVERNQEVLKKCLKIDPSQFGKVCGDFLKGHSDAMASDVDVMPEPESVVRNNPVFKCHALPPVISRVADETGRLQMTALERNSVAQDVMEARRRGLLSPLSIKVEDDDEDRLVVDEEGS